MLSTLDLTLIRVALRAWGVPLTYTDTQDQLLARFADVFGEKPIQAIKEFRAVTGLGLKESKDIWDRIKPLALAARERRDAWTPSVDLKRTAIDDFETVVEAAEEAALSDEHLRCIERVRNFLQNC